MKRLLILVLFAASAAFAESPEPLKGLHLNDLRLTPTQSGGRLKPFDEFAREMVLALTGSRKFGKFDPSEMVISMMVSPKEWSAEKIIRISLSDVNKQLLIDLDRKYFSPDELMSNNAFLQYAQSIETGGSQVTSTGVNAVTGKTDPRMEELKRVVDRMNRFQALIMGRLWAISPPEWKTLSDGMKTPTPQASKAYEMLKAYIDRNPDLFRAKAFELRESVEKATPEFAQSKNKILAETFYNRLRPFLQAMIFYLVAGLLWFFSNAHPVPRQMAKFLTIVAVLCHTIGFALRCYVAGRPPVTNMYESIVWVSLGVMVFATILFVKYRLVVLMATSTILAGLSLFAADAAPLVMDPTIRPLVPVLRSNYWLTIHVLTITLSYGAFMLAMGISNVTLYLFWKKGAKDRIALLNTLSYRALMFGTVLLAAGTILGGVWADYSWGRFWGWDPKEVWALIALLSYLAVLHGRYAGWVGTFAFPLWTVICFSTVVMAWYGVNFVLGVGLHSYGFSSGGQAFVACFILAQFAYCAFIAFTVKRTKGRVAHGT